MGRVGYWLKGRTRQFGGTKKKVALLESRKGSQRRYFFPLERSMQNLVPTMSQTNTPKLKVCGRRGGIYFYHGSMEGRK